MGTRTMIKQWLEGLRWWLIVKLAGARSVGINLTIDGTIHMGFDQKGDFMNCHWLDSIKYAIFCHPEDDE